MNNIDIEALPDNMDESIIDEWEHDFREGVLILSSYTVEDLDNHIHGCSGDISCNMHIPIITIKESIEDWIKCEKP